MSFLRAASAAIAVLLGALCLLVAFANLYNVDQQPIAILIAYALAGVLLIALGVTVARRGRGASKSVPPAL